MSRGLIRLFVRSLLLGAPLIALMAFYVALDPFEVLWPRDAHYGIAHVVPVNRDFASTDAYLRNPQRARLDSFIFGNSRSIFYRTSEWTHYLGDAVVPFHFDASGESVFGIRSKVRFLRKDGRRIRHALIILDAETLREAGDSSGHLLIKDPRVAGTSALGFHYEFFSAFFHPQFFGRYLAYRITGKTHPWLGEDFQYGLREVWQQRATNDLIPVALEPEIQKEGETFFQRLSSRYPRDLSRRPAPGPPVIGAEQRRMLAEVREMLAADGADVRIVVNPLYDRVPLNAADVATLRQLFGAGRVFDFSGSNAITDDVHNYYEQSHYRLHVARQILRVVYAAPPR